MALGFLAVHLVKRIIRKIPVVGIIARPILGRMHVLTYLDMTCVALCGSLAVLLSLILNNAQTCFRPLWWGQRWVQPSPTALWMAKATC